MSTLACAICNAPFSGRSDAVYCSAACRQKAHRARAARRLASMIDRLDRAADAGDRTGRADAGIRRSQELCERSLENRRRAAHLLQQSRAVRRALVR